jgi:hypothetical protein
MIGWPERRSNKYSRPHVESHKPGSINWCNWLRSLGNAEPTELGALGETE